MTSAHDETPRWRECEDMPDEAFGVEEYDPASWRRYLYRRRRDSYYEAETVDEKLVVIIKAAADEKLDQLRVQLRRGP